MYQSFWVQAYFRYIHLNCIRITGQVENNKTFYKKSNVFKNNYISSNKSVSLQQTPKNGTAAQ